MADSGSFHEETHLLAGSNTSFSQLLLSSDDDGLGHTFRCLSSGKPPKMLCFGGYHDEDDQIVLFSEASKATQRMAGAGILTCSDSSSASSGNNNNSVNLNTVSKPNRKRNESSQKPAQSTATIAKAHLTIQTSSKKTKTENLLPTGHAKVRKEKLGDRVTALQQLVSPFGKTDTASVLHEAMGYIRFLQDQVQVLCSPYLQHQREDGENGEEPKDLRSRGLCLVPVDCTVQVASSNGADYWSPAAMGNNFSSSSAKK